MPTADGVDYSFSRPDLACLARHGKTFVVRYLSTGPSGKNLSRAEVDRIRAADLRLVIVYEETAGRPLAGRDAGRADARVCVDWWKLFGYASPVPPIYFAYDQDPNSLTSSEVGTIGAYLDGCADILGRARVGLYAGFRLIEALCPAKAPFGWQTYAWSGGRWSSKAQLRQWRNGVTFCGGTVDLDVAMTTDYGQWPRPSGGDMLDEAHDSPIIEAAVGRALDAQARRVFGITSYERYLEVLLDAARDDGNPDIDETAVAAAIVTKLNPETLAAAVAAHLPAYRLVPADG